MYGGPCSVIMIYVYVYMVASISNRPPGDTACGITFAEPIGAKYVRRSSRLLVAPPMETMYCTYM